MFSIIRDIVIAVSAFVLLSFLLTRLIYVPRSVPPIACFIMITTMCGVRALYRYLIDRTRGAGLRLKSFTRTAQRHLLVYGASSKTDAFLRALQSEPSPVFDVIGIIDDDTHNRDRWIRGVEVLGTVSELAQIVKDFSNESISLTSLVLPASDISRPKLSEIIEAATGTGLRLVRLPHTCDLLQPQWANESFAFEPIKVTDLLSREPTNLRLESIDGLIRGKSIAVTGGGGSIGSELCRQLLRREPAKLIIIDQSELNLFNIKQELAAVDRRQVVQPVLATIRDRDRIQSIFRFARVDLVFHAAAYKHVSLVEANPIEGILTNVIGTACVAEAAAAVGAAAMIMVSTDKAVKPSCVMGLSKRIAEEYCQALDLASARRGWRTRFQIVRFGNVLGSSGSVVPTFEQQIRKGGPVTVTHPAMTRYFMTIPEAVELVLQASACSCEGETPRGAILVLEMGKPIAIVELARRMISLAGFVPEKDIAIQFVGIRDGEKLNEELFDDDEILQETTISGVRLARSQAQDLRQLQALCERLEAISHSADPKDVVAMLREFHSSGRYQASPANLATCVGQRTMNRKAS
jgi:O-antigen biosynthesis protein WbqV